MRRNESMIESLAWDSQFFGFPVGRLAAAVNEPAALKEALDEARDLKFRLIYWAAPTLNEVPVERWAPEFGGIPVGTRVEFVRSIPMSRPVTDSISTGSLNPSAADVARGRADAPEITGFLPSALREAPIADNAVRGAWLIEPYPCGPADSAICELARSAGEYSRFRLDRRTAGETFARLFDRWADEACRRRSASQVFFVRRHNEKIAGFCSVGHPRLDRADEIGLGLIAVAADCQGQGVGRLLLDVAEQTMSRLGAKRSVIHSQRENAAACRFYSHQGYQIRDEQRLFHFWLDAGAED